MSFSYDPEDPGATDVASVRTLIQDVDPAHPHLSDEQIQWQIDSISDIYDDVRMWAAYCAEMVAAQHAGDVSISADGVTISGNQLRDQWKQLAESLRCEYKQIAGVGIDAASAQLAGGAGAVDRTLAPLTFGIGMHDNPDAGRQDFGGRERWGEPYDAPYGYPAGG
jgi:hypothetical protein